MDEYMNINMKIIKNIEEKNRNYEILNNMKELMENNKIVEDINKTINEKDINNKFKNILYIYNEMSNKEENNKDSKGKNNLNIRNNNINNNIDNNKINNIINNNMDNNMGNNKDKNYEIIYKIDNKDKIRIFGKDFVIIIKIKQIQEKNKPHKKEILTVVIRKLMAEKMSKNKKIIMMK